LTKFVFDTQNVRRYRFPTHTNDLIMDRAEASASEAFFVVLEPGEAVPLHVHDGVEQVFYILDGVAELTVGLDEPERFPLRAGDFVRTPPGVHHAVKATGSSRFVYLSIDCFVAGKPTDEPSWDRHVEQMCLDNGWDLDSVRHGAVTPDYLHRS
jgi:mannose-6-phosphate isomerase-like protein (cupin superfamily)